MRIEKNLANRTAKRSPYYGLRVLGPLAATLATVALGGCSSSLPAMFGDDKPAAVARSENLRSDPKDITGSLAITDGVKVPMSPVDWTIAKSALRETLGRSEAGASQPWENPTTGARGTVTPVAAIYEKNGFPCRDFILSNVHDSKESWYEGTACRVHRGQWDVTNSRPLQKS